MPASKKREPRAGQKRFRLVLDDSSHWYAIPADDRDAFEKWAESFEHDKCPVCSHVNGDEEHCGGPWHHAQGYDFDGYRLSRHPSNYTFERMLRDA